MNEALQNLEIKVKNGGSTPQGRVSAAEWNVLVAGVKALDLAGLNEESLRDYLDQYDYITRPELDKALEGIGGGSGGSIAYPLTWSGFSQGAWDGSASANIAIPSLLSQLQNDVEFITSASVNSLLTDYLSKSGGTINGDFFLKKPGNATIIFQPSNAAKNFWFGVNTSEEWFCTNGGYTETYKLIHSGNLSEYGGEWLANAELDANAIHHGFRAGKVYNAKGLIDAYRGFLEYGFDRYAAQFNSNSENDLFYRWCENGTWLDWRKVAFTDSTMYPTGDIAMQFPDGEYIDRYGNIVLPSTARQWSVKNSNMMLLSVRNDGEIQLNGTIHFTKEVPMIKMVENGWAQSKVMWHGWDSTEGDSLWLQIPSGVENDVYFKLCRLAPSILNTSLQVNGNITANSLSVYGTTLLSYTAGDFPFKDVLNFTWSDSAGDGIKLSVPGYHAEDIFLQITVGGGAVFNSSVAAPKFIGALQGHADSATLWSYNSPWVQDFDALNYSNNGLYHFDGDYANLTGRPPYNSWNYSVLNMGSGSGRRQQVAIPYNICAMFLRVNVDDNWSGWREVSFVDTDFLTPSSGILTVNGNLLATGEITQHSSLVLKDVVDTRFLTLKELSELKPYIFYWKDKRDDKLHAGAVADYVMPILPEVISTDKDNIHSMNYANAAWIVGTSLTTYVSKHEEEIAKLKERVKYLENKLKGC